MMGREKRSWIAFANEKKCNHTKCLLTKGFVSWVDSYGFQIGDIVYLFMSNSRNIRFKTIVEKCEVPREDSDFWIEKAPKDLTSRLKLIAESNSALLKEENLKKHHFNGGRSLQRPIYKNEQLIAYIQENF